MYKTRACCAYWYRDYSKGKCFDETVQSFDEDIHCVKSVVHTGCAERVVIMSLPSFILASNERSNSRDDVRKENDLLWTELDSLQREHKKLKQVVEQLARDYEESKYFDPLRRYEKMKGMIKRTILHLRLNHDDKGSSCGISGLIQSCRDYAHQVEAGKRREQHQHASKSRTLL